MVGPATDIASGTHRAVHNGEPQPLWCTRHWEPCPAEGKNGMLATMELMSRALEEMPWYILQGGVSSMNAWLGSQAGPACCRLGDEAVRKIWADC